MKNKYHDYAVMDYGVYLGLAVLSNMVDGVVAKSILIAAAILFLCLKREQKESWSCSNLYRVWALSVIFVFGGISVQQIFIFFPVDSNFLRKLGIVLFLIEMISINIIWRASLQKRLIGLQDKQVREQLADPEHKAKH